MLVDLDYFYAQCEERRKPSIRNKPVVVCVYSGRGEDSGAVSTANYIARKYDVKSGISISLAKARLKEEDSVFLPVDHEFYRGISDMVMTILRKYADTFEKVGIDEAYLDVSIKVKGSFDQAVHLARKIKKEVKDRTGLSCSIGIGVNKLVAKIAADVKKPDGLTVGKPEQTSSFLSPLPVSRLIGVGRKMEDKMLGLGVRTIGDLSKLDVQKLVHVFGLKLGVYFHNASNGIHDEPVKERGEVKSFSRISTLKKDTRDINFIFDKTNQLCEEVYSRLTQAGLGFKTIRILLVTSDMGVHSRSKTFNKQSEELEVIKITVKELVERFLCESDESIRRVGVKLSNFERHRDQKRLTEFIGL